MAEKFMDLSSFNVDVKSIRLKSLNGEDMVVAAGRCAPMDGASLDPMLFSIMMRQQQIAQAIIEVNGEPVRGPCLASRQWSLRTMNLVGKIYDSLNSLTSSDDERFMTALNGASAAPTQVAASAEDSSKSGSGSPGT